MQRTDSAVKLPNNQETQNKPTNILSTIFFQPIIHQVKKVTEYTKTQLFSLAHSGCLKVLTKTRLGYIQMTLTNGSTLHFGDKNSSLTSKIKVLDDEFWARLALFSALGAGEGYMYNQFQVDDLGILLKIFVLNRDYYNEMNLLPSGFNSTLNQLCHSHIPNTIKNALYNIEAHYDLGNDMFSAFLDPTMTYSCPIWTSESESLEQAQLNKIHAILSKACIQSGFHILEIGTGWGTLAMEAVKHYDCRVTSLTLSKEQKSLAEARIKEAGLEDQITVLLMDYRDLQVDEKFDAIVSVEMLEAVGPEFLDTFFEKCHSVLHPQHGIMVFQVITMPENRYESYKTKVDFIQKHIFPGGHCPSVTAITNAIQKGSKGELIIDHLENIGPHYAKALRLWRREFLNSFEKVASNSPCKELYSDVFKRKWEFYFAFCEAGFASGTLGDVQVRLTRSCNSLLLEDIPM